MKNEFYYPSADGKTQIHAIEWIPDGEVKMILQMCHGMVEYIDRYHEFAEFLAERGIYVVGHDHLGHGESVIGVEKLGFFAETNGNACVIADIHQLRMKTEQKYPDIPYCMLGHSMGSFLLRQYIGMHGDGLAGAVIMGTGHQPWALLAVGKMFCRITAVFKGWEYRSRFVDQAAFGGFNRKFRKETDGSNWISRNPENARRHEEDPLCTFMFTINAYYNMFCGIQAVNRQEKAGKISKVLPVFFVSGQNDPVGNFGKSVENVSKKYKECGIKDVELKLYSEDRHEILNEVDREMVYQDIYEWMKKRR